MINKEFLLQTCVSLRGGRWFWCLFAPASCSGHQNTAPLWTRREQGGSFLFLMKEKTIRYHPIITFVLFVCFSPCNSYWSSKRIKCGEVWCRFSFGWCLQFWNFFSDMGFEQYVRTNAGKY